MSLSLTQQRTLAILPKVSGGLSLAFSILIVATILCDKHHKRSKVYHRLICGMALADISSSFALCLSTWPIPATTGILWASGTGATCKAQGFFTQFGISSPLYNVSLSVYYVLAVRSGWKEDRLRLVEPWFHALPILWALITAVAGLPLDIFNSADLWCWIGPSSPGRDNDVYRWAFFYGPLWAAIVVVTAHLWLLFWYVRRVTLKSEQYVLHPSSTFPTASRMSRLHDGDDFFATQHDDDAVYYDQGFSSRIAFSQQVRKSSRKVPARPASEEVVFEKDEPINNDDATGEAQDNQQESLPPPPTPSLSQILPATGYQVSSEASRVMPAAENTVVSETSQVLSATRNRLTSEHGQVGSMSLNDSVSSRILGVRRKHQNKLSIRSSTSQFLQRRRQVAHQCLRYAFAFYWTWIPITAVRILQTANHPPVFALYALAAFNTPFQGLPNFIVYLYPMILKAKKQTAANSNGRNNNLWEWIRISLTPVQQPSVATPVATAQS